ncbi:MAG: YdeI/OmpD-associated family protein [Actinomycetota bacterium]|nr:YdeI/OmpD-associated family protein [Actinomycetota bacterium]
MNELPVLQPASAKEWEEWLETNHASSAGVWVRLAKKGSVIETVSYAEAVEGALCYGWIDSQAAGLDDQFWLQRFTPRAARSRWSRVNRDRAEELIRQGRMRSAGLAQVERAREDGRWDAAYESQSTATVPADLQRELDRHPAAARSFAALDRGNRYAILYRIAETKRAETRARRIERFVTMLAAGETLRPRP